VAPQSRLEQPDLAKNLRNVGHPNSFELAPIDDTRALLLIRDSGCKANFGAMLSVRLLPHPKRLRYTPSVSGSAGQRHPLHCLTLKDTPDG
jgi:hypothetical protein